MKKLKITYVPISDLHDYSNNAKLHPDNQIEAIANSIKEFGNCDPIGIWTNEEGKYEIVEGHGRKLALQRLGHETAPCVFLDHLTNEQRRAYTLVHNQTTLSSGFDEELLLSELDDLDFDFSELGFSEVEAPVEDFEEPVEPKPKEEHAELTDDFVVPPFSVLDTRQGYWKKRKQIWNNKIQDGAAARSHATVYSSRAEYMPTINNDVSLLDPVLAEIIVRYFTPTGGGKCFDTFSGDTAFGFVSSYLGNSYTGIELRQEQADFNNGRVQEHNLNARYICDDGRNVLNHLEEESQDLFFSCPPYFDMEVYSDKPNDASNQPTWEGFYDILDTAFTRAVKCLKQNRFAVIVCTDIRDRKTGFYYDFQGDVIRTFTNAGMHLYNNVILATPVGTAAIRARQSMKTRKLCRVHQNVLVFYKGDPDKIKDEFGEIEVSGGDFDAGEDA